MLKTRYIFIPFCVLSLLVIILERILSYPSILILYLIILGLAIVGLMLSYKEDKNRKINFFRIIYVTFLVMQFCKVAFWFLEHNLGFFKIA